MLYLILLRHSMLGEVVEPNSCHQVFRPLKSCPALLKTIYLEELLEHPFCCLLQPKVGQPIAADHSAESHCGPRALLEDKLVAIMDAERGISSACTRVYPFQSQGICQVSASLGNFVL